MQTFVHYFLHFVFPLFIAFLFFKKEWKRVYLVFLATNLVDLDHLFANPIFQADRCSIGYHFLHTYPAVIGYILLLFFKRTLRWAGLGLLLHTVTDFIDCLFMFNRCSTCYIDAPSYKLLQVVSQLLGQ